jgi:putative spermidine/putrescine transport system substrate-binding protein
LLPASGMARTWPNEMTIVSWGGAYQASQINAYSEPYKAMHEGVSK